MPGRQIAIVLVSLIVIVGAALFVLSWSGDGDDTTDAADQTTTSTVSATSTTTTSTAAPTTTSIPVLCTADDADTDDADTTTTTAASPDDTADDPADDEGADDATAAAGPTLGPNSTLSTVGLDTVDFGMTVTQAERASGHELVLCEPVSKCYRVTPAGAPEGISFLVHEGTIERVDIVAGPIETRSGIGIGSPGERPVELWPDQIERLVLGTDAVDLIFVPADDNDAEFRVVFTVVDGEVASLRAGRVPMVLDADPCAAA